MFDKNEIDSGWLLWCHKYALGYLLKTDSARNIGGKN